MPSATAILYFVWFAAAGISVTFWPYHMEALGLDDSDIGNVFAVRTAISIAAQLGLIVLSARLSRPGPLLIVLATWTLLTALLMPSATTGLLLASVFWVQTPSQATLVPVLDALVVNAVGARTYGRFRRWGSLGYGVGVAAFGVWTGHLSHEEAGALSLPTFAALSALVLVAAFPLRAQDSPRPTADEPLSIRRLASPPLLVFLGINAIHWASITVFNVFFPLHTKALGFGNAIPGIAVLVAVVAEFVAFWAAARLLAARSTTFWLVAALATGALRWLGTAVVDDPVALIALQVIHFFSFGVWLSSVMDVLVGFGPPSARSALQAMLFATVFGGGGIVGSVGGGWLMAWGGGHAAFLGAAAAEVIAAAAVLLTRSMWQPRDEPQPREGP